MAKPVIGLSPRIKDENGMYSVKEKYVKQVKKLGCKPIVFQPSLISVKNYVDKVDGILLLGDRRDVHPSFYNEGVIYERDFMEDSLVRFEIALVKEAKTRDKPVLAICYGCQVLNVVFEGTLYQSIPDHVNKIVNHQKSKDTMHEITIKENTLLHKILEEEKTIVNSNHHQGIRDVGRELRASAFAEDGLCEAIEHENAYFILGLQWHPERLKKKSSSKLFKAFIKACKRKF